MAVLLARNFETFLFLFSIGYGICNGLTYMVPMNHGWLWFPTKPGLVSGIIIGGFGIGTFAFSLICEKLVNPNNEESVDNRFPPDVNERVPLMLKVFTGANICIVLLAIAMIFPGKDSTSPKEVQRALSRTISMSQEWLNSPQLRSLRNNHQAHQICIEDRERERAATLDDLEGVNASIIRSTAVRASVVTSPNSNLNQSGVRRETLKDIAEETTSSFRETQVDKAEKDDDVKY